MKSAPLSLKNARGVAGEPITVYRLVTIQTGGSEPTAAGKFKHSSSRAFIPMGVALTTANTGGTFSYALPGQVLVVEAGESGAAGEGVYPLNDGTLGFASNGNLGSALWAGIALEDSVGAGEHVQIWFWPNAADALGQEVSP